MWRRWLPLQPAALPDVPSQLLRIVERNPGQSDVASWRLAEIPEERSMRTYEIQPSASRLIGSLRDIGYDFNTAVADLVDNSIEAGATHVEIEIRFKGTNSTIMICDDGGGMTEKSITEALRFGSEREYGADDLGRYGLGLKTASLSQCRRVSVLSRRSQKVNRIAGRQLDLDRIEETNRWEVVDPERVGNIDLACHRLRRGPGTIVVWENLDRVLGTTDPTGGWAKRRLAKLAPQIENYLGMVFHRFLSGELIDRPQLHISVNGQKVSPWDPFARAEQTMELQSRYWEIPSGSESHLVVLKRYILPPRELFSSPDEFERMGGPAKWNRQQGLYIYRSHRLIQGGGWGGMRTIDEHTKLARASLEFKSGLDSQFHVNVAKMKVSVPSEVRTMLEGPVHELCQEADKIYRAHSAVRTGRDDERPREGGSHAGIGLAIRASAMAAGMTVSQLRTFESHLRRNHPDVADLLGA